MSMEMNLTMPGQYIDAETGWFYNGQRTYCPRCGRYTQADPIALNGGPNQFIYVGGSPLTLVDQSGLKVYSFGFTGSLNVPLLGPIGAAGTWSAGLVWDGHGNVGLYGTTSSAGVGVGAGAGVGISASVYGGDKISDYAGPFDNSAIGAGLGGHGSIDVYRDPSKSFTDLSGYGGGITIGVGVGGSASVVRTDTMVVPLTNPRGKTCPRK